MKNMKKTKNSDLQMQVDLKTMTDVKEFNSACCDYSGDIDVAYGRYVVDAKSILGLFSLDLSKQLICTIHVTENEVELQKLKEAISKFA